LRTFSSGKNDVRQTTCGMKMMRTIRNVAMWKLSRKTTAYC